MRLVSKYTSLKNVSTIVLIIVAISFFFFTSSMMVAKEKSLETLEKALVESDGEVLVQLLTSADPKVAITEENIDVFISYLDNFKKDKDSLLEAIKKHEDHELLSIKVKKKWMFFEDYVFQVKPYYIEFSVDEHVKEIEIVGVETLLSQGAEKIRSGPLMPGKYNIIATHQTGYAPDYTSSTQIAVIPVVANDERVIKSGIGTKFIVFNVSNALGGTVLVNGKETGLIIENYEQKIYGIPTDGSVTLSVKKQFPWGEITSEEKVVDKNKIFLHLDSSNETVTEQVLQIAKEFAASWKEAFNKRDVSLLKHVTPDMKERMESKMAELRAAGVTVLKTTEVQEQIETYLLPIETVERFKLPAQFEHYSASVSIVENFENLTGIGGSLYVAYYNLEEGTWVFYQFHSPAAY